MAKEDYTVKKDNTDNTTNELTEFIKTVAQLDQIGLILIRSNAEVLLASEKMRNGDKQTT